MSDITLYDYDIKLFSTEDSSRKYGPCEVCQTNCSEIYHMVVLPSYKTQEGAVSYTYNDKHISLFGCRECLLAKIPPDVAMSAKVFENREEYKAHHAARREEIIPNVGTFSERS